MGRIRQLVRTALSYMPRLGILEKPLAHRPNGISTMMTVKDEEDWIEKSVRSIAGVVDELVVVDNGSTDETPAILQRLENEMAGKLRAFRFDAEDYCAAVNYTLSKTRYKWIFRWPGDFVARTSGDFSIAKLISRVGLLDPDRYYCIWLGPISLDGDLFHQIPQTEVEREPLLFVYSPVLHYEQEGRFEVLPVPWYYKRLDWQELYFFHMRYVKPARRILYRFFWTEWMSLSNRSRYPTLDAYVRHRIREVYGTSDLKEAMRLRMRDLGKELVRYDKIKFGEYPDIIRPDLEHPKYLLVYRGDEIVSRNDVEGMSPSDRKTPN